MNSQLEGSGEYHIPVLLQESVEALITNLDGIYVDLTFGGGGHSLAILDRLSETGKLFAFDQDEDAFRNKPNDKRLVLIKANFRFFENYLRYHQIHTVDGVLADLGVSSYQFDTGSRGFSIRFDAPLDMRMDRKQPLHAQKVLNEYDEKQLADVFYYYGELRNARQLAAKIVQIRRQHPILTTTDLKNALKGIFKPQHEKDLMIQVFQAIRIEVNGELDALKEMLEQSARVIKPGGKLVVISYHSLEDRLVKNFLRAGNFEGEQQKDLYGNVIAPFKPQSAKAITATEDEVKRNPRSRSARMRIGIRNN
ncbi:MAG: 16S rRNA (cytosine(1402)-N(4))-methyltransferase RsmH [Flavobacteriales bacterium]|nr:16S rRNA (cytosine(1402)-N(4))-methyltransferase RsmH [Flavobacteriales bacterium]